MKCRNPFIKGGAAFPCGQCMPCRFNRRRVWTHRILLESYQHAGNSFLTLTYSDDALPLTPNGLPTLEPADLRNFLKRFRKSIEPMRIRYFAVGEYGDESGRPHYHLAVFGYPSCERESFFGGGECRCETCSRVRDAWTVRGKCLGRIFSGSLTAHSAQYIAGYVTKKLTRSDDPRLHGRQAEFSRMSLNPGLGDGAMDAVATVFDQLGLVDREADVPSALRHGTRLLPLGRFLQRRLREKVWGCPDAPPEAVEAAKERVRAVYEASRLAPTPEARKLAFRNGLLEASDQAVAEMMAKAEIYKQRKRI